MDIAIIKQLKDIPHNLESIINLENALDVLSMRYEFYRDRNDHILLDILYPQITITNGSGNYHIIKDIVVIMNFGKYFDISKSIQGKRLSASIEEIQCGYRHSHLPRSPHTQYVIPSNFCFGTSNFSNFLEELSKEIHPVSNDTFTLFLRFLYNYLCWESIEGTPYIYMTEIVVRANSVLTEFNPCIADIRSLIYDDNYEYPSVLYNDATKLLYYYGDGNITQMTTMFGNALVDFNVTSSQEFNSYIIRNPFFLKINKIVNSLWKK
jgi:hypothetical protein